MGKSLRLDVAHLRGFEVAQQQGFLVQQAFGRHEVDQSLRGLTNLIVSVRGERGFTMKGQSIATFEAGAHRDDRTQLPLAQIHLLDIELLSLRMSLN